MKNSLTIATAIAFALLAFALATSGCDGPMIGCTESACLPNETNHYCSCNYGQHMERQTDGVIICRCYTTDAGH